MTRKDALAELIAKVEAGRWDTAAGGYAILSGLSGNAFTNASKAYFGSLDAAMAMHVAVLPGCSQYSIVTDPTCLCVKVCWWPDGLSGGTEIHGEGWSEDGPARAWLLAILRALHSMEPDRTP